MRNIPREITSAVGYREDEVTQQVTILDDSFQEITLTLNQYANGWDIYQNNKRIDFDIEIPNFITHIQ
jgi:hypothetical protein